MRERDRMTGRNTDKERRFNENERQRDRETEKKTVKEREYEKERA